jgi:superoxide reductase
MTKRLEVYECKKCGNIVEVLHEGKGRLVCCGEPMVLHEENTVDASREKHVPAVEKTETGYRVVVGSEIHPMVEKHYIEWIEMIHGDKVCRRFLYAGDQPEVVFNTDADKVLIRAYCNLHGLWKTEAE